MWKVDACEIGGMCRGKAWYGLELREQGGSQLHEGGMEECVHAWGQQCLEPACFAPSVVAVLHGLGPREPTHGTRTNPGLVMRANCLEAPPWCCSS